MNNLKPGQTYEIKRSLHWKESKTIHTRVIIYRLTDKQIQERRKNKVTLKVKRVLHFQKRVND
jgi:nitrogen fixation protein FixH